MISLEDTSITCRREKVKRNFLKGKPEGKTQHPPVYGKGKRGAPDKSGSSTFQNPHALSCGNTVSPTQNPFLWGISI
jgi:hypothetical protein